MSKTVYSFVICITSLILSFTLSSFSSPPCFLRLGKALTKEPMPFHFQRTAGHQAMLKLKLWLARFGRVGLLLFAIT
jgi:hypothetical protein